jgi:hypothetical protein
MSYITLKIEKASTSCNHPLVKSNWLLFTLGNNNEVILSLEIELLDGKRESFESTDLFKCIEKAEEFLKSLDSITSQTH